MDAEFAKAFVKMQSELPTVPKGREGQEGKQKYKYADLASIMEVAGPVLSAHGFALMQPAKVVDQSGEVYAGVTTILVHESGASESFETLLPVKVEYGTMTKAVGGVITYARRYALSIIGICTEDDSESAPGVGSRPSDPPRARKASPQKGKDAHLDAASKEKMRYAATVRLKELGIEDADGAANDVCRDVLKAHGYASSIEAKQSDFPALFAAVQAWEPGEAAA